MATSVLFIGGTGIISSACVARALARGDDVTVLNRGTTSKRPLAEGARLVTADVRDPASVREALGDSEFDVVAEFVAFTPDHVRTDLELFGGGRTGQYVFISSASAYQTPALRLPVTESTPLRNPHWQYSRDKIACEDVLVAAYRDSGFPATIVRPSHTYDRTMVPTTGGWTDIARMRRGVPVVIHGDGSSLWTLTHHTDFAKAFVGLLGHPAAVGDSFTITSDEAPSWTQVYAMLAAAAGADLDAVYVPSATIAAQDAEIGASLLGDKTHSSVFDCSKVRSLVPEFVCTTPFWRGAAEIVEWYDANPQHAVVDENLDALFDRLVEGAR
jgi:nucleoside-diphosphate-sugar epimerase